VVTAKTVTLVIAHFFSRSTDSRLLGAPAAQGESVGGRDAQLLSPGYRRTIATGLRRLVDRAEKPPTIAQAQLRRQAIRENSGELLTLANEVEYEPEIRARGVILASRLVDDSSSPAYDLYGGPTDLARAVRHARTALLLG
jgi:hypothetical protein